MELLPAGSMADKLYVAQHNFSDSTEHIPKVLHINGIPMVYLHLHRPDKQTAEDIVAKCGLAFFILNK